MKILAGLLDKTNGDVKVFNENPMDNLLVLLNIDFTCDKNVKVIFIPTWSFMWQFDQF